MPLYDQQTSLQGQGRFSPSVNYYAGIRKPNQPNPHLERANTSFNIDLSRIGDAMIRQSDNQMRTDIELAKIEANKNAKAQEEALKQLKTSMGNQLAMEIAHVTDAVNQGLSPLSGQRQMRQIQDRYLSYNVLDANTISSIISQSDGGIYNTQTRDRSQWQAAFNQEKIDKLKEVHTRMPWTVNLSPDKALAMAYDMDNEIANTAAAVMQGNMVNGVNYPAVQQGLDMLAGSSVDSMLANAVYSGENLSKESLTASALRSASAIIDSMPDSPNKAQMLADLQQGVLNRLKPWMQNYADMTEQEKKATANMLSITENRTMLGIWGSDPARAAATLALKKGIVFTTEDGQPIPGIYTATTTSPAMLAIEGEKLPAGVRIPLGSGGTRVQASGTWEQTGDGVYIARPGIVGYMAPNGVVSETPYDENYVAAAMAMKGIIAPGGVIGGPLRSQLLYAANKDPNFGGIPYSDFTKLSQEQQNAIINNRSAVYNTVTSSAARNSNKQQQAYDGRDWNKEMQDAFDTDAAVWTRDNLPAAKRIIQAVLDNKGEASGLQESRYRILPQDGRIYYTPTEGALQWIGEKFAGSNIDTALKNIEAAAIKEIPNDPYLRSKVLYAIMNSEGLNITYADPNVDTKLTRSPSMGAEAVKGVADTANVIGENTVLPLAKTYEELYNLIYPYIEKAVHKGLGAIEQGTTDYLKFAEQRGRELAQGYEAWTKENGYDNPWTLDAFGAFMNEAVKDLINDGKVLVEDAGDLIKESKASFNNWLETSKTGKALTKAASAVKETYTTAKDTVVNTKTLYDMRKTGGLADYAGERDFDFQAGPLDIKNPDNFPVFTDADGNEYSVKTATIGSDGRTYIVKTVDENGNDITPEDALEGGLILGSVAGEDRRSVAAAERMADNMRNYIVGNSPKSGIDVAKHVENYNNNRLELPITNVDSNKSFEENATEVILTTATNAGIIAKQISNTVGKIDAKKVDAKLDKLSKDYTKAANAVLDQMGEDLGKTVDATMFPGFWTAVEMLDKIEKDPKNFDKYYMEGLYALGEATEGTATGNQMVYNMAMLSGLVGLGVGYGGSSIFEFFYDNLGPIKEERFNPRTAGKELPIDLMQDVSNIIDNPKKAVSDVVSGIKDITDFGYKHFTPQGMAVKTLEDLYNVVGKTKDNTAKTIEMFKQIWLSTLPEDRRKLIEEYNKTHKNDPVGIMKVISKIWRQN